MRLLIADDEMQIRTGLEQGIDWKTLGFQEVFTAKNGVEALDICNEYEPELIITDIRMPGIDGLELSRQVTRLYKSVEIIILSGYSDFDYAREAIKLGAYDYLLKPINIEELLERVKNAQNSIICKVNETKNQDVYQQINRKREMQYLLQNKEKLHKEDRTKFVENLNIDPSKKLLAGICSVDVLQDNLSQFGIYLTTCVTELFKNYAADVLFWDKGTLLFLMEVFTKAELERKKKKLMIDINHLNKKLKNQFNNTVSVAISSMGSAEEIPLLFRECDRVLKHRLYLGAQQLMSVDDVIENRQIPLNPVNVKDLKQNIERFDYNNSHNYLQNIFLELEDMKITSVDFVRGICLELKNILISTVLDKGVDIESIFEYNQELLNDIPMYYTLQEYFGWINNLYYLILEGLSQLVGKQHSRMIIQAVDYMSKNYVSNINLESTAEYVNKSKNYLSYLFKKEMGVSFIEYLNGVRIEQAKKLLDTTDDMTYEIAEKVGYSNYKYFSSVFKKMTGMSPAKYRKIGES